jgi:hypothetical protein
MLTEVRLSAIFFSPFKKVLGNYSDTGQGRFSPNPSRLIIHKHNLYSWQVVAEQIEVQSIISSEIRYPKVFKVFLGSSKYMRE